MIEKHELFDLIPKSEMDKVLDYEYCEFDISFLGFTEYYKALASCLPKGTTIIDFGCNQALQSYYFKDFDWYIGIDVAIPVDARYKTDNSMHYQDEICHWITSKFSKLDIPQTECFAICNYVPDWGAQALIKQTFQNVFNYYPEVRR